MISHYKAFGAKVKEEPAGGMGKGDRARRGRSFEGPERKKKCRPVGRHFGSLGKNSALGELGSATGSLEAALLARPVRRCRPGTPGGWNMLGANELPLRQGFGRGPKRLYGAVRRPALRGPEGAQEKMPPDWAAF